MLSGSCVSSDNWMHSHTFLYASPQIFHFVQHLVRYLHFGVRQNAFKLLEQFFLFALVCRQHQEQIRQRMGRLRIIKKLSGKILIN
jgi:hypothetical protein